MRCFASCRVTEVRVAEGTDTWGMLSILPKNQMNDIARLLLGERHCPDGSVMVPSLQNYNAWPTTQLDLSFFRRYRAFLSRGNFIYSGLSNNRHACWLDDAGADIENLYTK